MTTKSKRVYVLVDDDQVPLSPSEVAEMVSLRGFTGAAVPYGYSEETLRAFLQRNGYKAQTTIVYEKESQLPEGAPITMEIPQVPVPAGSEGFRLDRKVRSSSGG